MKNNHKTSTGKIFELYDKDGNPADYEENKGLFSRQDMGMIEVGQSLEHEATGMTLKRIK